MPSLQRVIASTKANEFCVCVCLLVAAFQCNIHECIFQLAVRLHTVLCTIWRWCIVLFTACASLPETNIVKSAATHQNARNNRVVILLYVYSYIVFVRTKNVPLDNLRWFIDSVSSEKAKLNKTLSFINISPKKAFHFSHSFTCLLFSYDFPESAAGAVDAKIQKNKHFVSKNTKTI